MKVESQNEEGEQANKMVEKMKKKKQYVERKTKDREL